MEMEGEAGQLAVPPDTSNGGDSWEYSLRKYLLLLATLVATVTYAAGFNPPGGVWQDADPALGRIAGDPIIRDTSYRRYLVYFYSNATAFASSLVVIVLVLALAALHDRGSASLAPLCILRVVMVLDLLSLMGAYAAGTFRDTFTAVYSWVLIGGVVAYLAVHMAIAWRSRTPDESADDRRRKVFMVLATFAVSVTYVAGLSAPGGFWDHAEGGSRPGRAILMGGRHDARLKAFLVCNTTAFVASLLVIMLLLQKKLFYCQMVRSFELYGFIAVTLVGLVAAYSAGSCREIDTTIYVNALIGAVLVWILLQVIVVRYFDEACEAVYKRMSTWLREVATSCCLEQPIGPITRDEHERQQQARSLEKARSLVLLLATLAAAITYQAGLDPPGGVWQDDGAGHKAGDPILLTTNRRRYKAFFYCNSVTFVASLVAIILAQRKVLHRHNALEATMVLGLLGLIGAYAAGSCRDVGTSIYAMALAGAVLVYVVIHVVFLTLDHRENWGNDEASIMKREEADELMEKKRKRLLLFAILAATITYQAGLTPPSGFLQKDDEFGYHAGDPILLYNYPRRYKAFFYCNSVSFMLSIALIILLVNPNLYRPAIRSHALSVCTAAGMFGLIGAYGAGSTQHLKTSIYIFALAGAVMCAVVLLVAVFVWIHVKNQQDGTSSSSVTSTTTNNIAADDSTREGIPQNADIESARIPENGGEEPSSNGEHNAVIGNAGTEVNRAESSASGTQEDEEKKLHAKHKYLMLLGILVASITYQAGLEPPGGVWQGGHAAGHPVMHDNQRPRYLAFFYSNSTSFVASVVVIVLLLPEWHKDKWWLRVMNTTIVLDLLGLLVAYAAGSSRSWKTTGYVSALVIAVLAYFAIHVVLSCFSRRRANSAAVSGSSSPSSERNSAR